MRVVKRACGTCDGDGFEEVDRTTVKPCTTCAGGKEFAHCPLCQALCELEGAWWKCTGCGRTFEEIREEERAA